LLKTLEAILDLLKFGEREDGRNQQPTWKCCRSLHSHVYPPMAFCCHPQHRRRSCTPSQSLSLASVFFLQGISCYYYLMSSVGVSIPLPIPPSLLKARVHQFLPHAGLLFIFFPPTDSTVMQKRSPLLLFFCIPVWSPWRPLHSRRKDDLCHTDPPHPRFLTVHSLFYPFFQFSVPFIIWLATSVSIVLHLEFVCTSSHHTHPILSSPQPSALSSDPSRWRFLGV